MGGIDGQEWVPSITAFVTYQIKWKVQGQETMVTFGFYNTIVDEKILGRPIIKRYKMIYEVVENLVKISASGVYFPVSHERPYQDPYPPTHVEG